MTYTCKSCTFIFSRREIVSQCPYCGKNKISIASEEEQHLLESILEGESISI